MTTPLNEVAGQQLEFVQLAFPLQEAEQLESALRWLLPALEDRPNLTAKQRERRRVTRVAIDGLLTQLRARIQVDTPDQPPVANGVQPPP